MLVALLTPEEFFSVCVFEAEHEDSRGAFLRLGEVVVLDIENIEFLSVMDSLHRQHRQCC